MPSEWLVIRKGERDLPRARTARTSDAIRRARITGVCLTVQALHRYTRIVTVYCYYHQR